MISEIRYPMEPPPNGGPYVASVAGHRSAHRRSAATVAGSASPSRPTPSSWTNEAHVFARWLRAAARSRRARGCASVQLSPATAERIAELLELPAREAA